MGLVDKIYTLQTRYEAAGTAEKGQALAEAIAQLILRKKSKAKIDGGVRELVNLLQEIGKAHELNAAAGGVNILHIGAWDKKAAVKIWLEGIGQETPTTAQEKAAAIVGNWSKSLQGIRIPSGLGADLVHDVAIALDKAEAAAYERGLADGQE